MKQCTFNNHIYINIHKNVTIGHIKKYIKRTHTHTHIYIYIYTVTCIHIRALIKSTKPIQETESTINASGTGLAKTHLFTSPFLVTHLFVCAIVRTHVTVLEGQFDRVRSDGPST